MWYAITKLLCARKLTAHGCLQWAIVSVRGLHLQSFEDIGVYAGCDLTLSEKQYVFPFIDVELLADFNLSRGACKFTLPEDRSPMLIEQPIYRSRCRVELHPRIRRDSLHPHTYPSAPGWAHVEPQLIPYNVKRW